MVSLPPFSLPFAQTLPGGRGYGDKPPGAVESRTSPSGTSPFILMIPITPAGGAWKKSQSQIQATGEGTIEPFHPDIGIGTES